MNLPDDVRAARRLRELEVLYESLRALTSTLDLAAVVRSVLSHIRAVTSAEALSLLLYDAERAELVFAASEMLCAETLAGAGTPRAGGVGLEPGRLGVALRRGEQVVGFVELQERWDGRPFDEADRERVQAVASALAASVDPAALAHDPDALRAAFARVTAAVASQTAVLRLQDPRGGELVFTTSRVRPGVVDGLRLRLDQGIAGWVARHREAVCLEDATADPRHDPTLARKTGLVPRSMICAPLEHRDALLGVLQVINKVDGTSFTPDELRLVQALGGHAALAIANAQLYRQVEAASLTDDLTGLGNTRRFNVELPAALARGGPVSLLVLDLDGLKRIVDRHGHLVGSRTIATVGRLVAASLRPGDAAARFGGDEFVVVLPATSTAAACERAEIVRAAVATCRVPDGMDVDVRALTASIGVATFPAHAGDAEELFRAADRALSGVKGRGKNAVGVAD